MRDGLGGGGGGLNTLPQPGVLFNLRRDILKSEPLDEGHLPTGGYLFICRVPPLCFEDFLLEQKV